MDFSLFYFADTGAVTTDRYRLLLDGARFADTHGFSAVWTPERHFHRFGGLYPNPAVTGAAIAAITERIGIRAGSVVAPLHHPARIAEEWSVVDNISHGRVGISFASGWNAVDFALRPEAYSDHKTVLLQTVQAVRQLWRQEPVEVSDGAGNPQMISTFPPPIQPELPVWLTSAGSIETFRAAGEGGMGLLTHLLGQNLNQLAEKIAAYRQAYAASDRADGSSGHVALMLHTFLGESREQVREQVRVPFSEYLRSSLGLFARQIAADLPGVNLDRLSPADLDFLIQHAFDRYFETSGLFGTVDDGVKIVDELRRIGVDDLACLVDFGVETDLVLNGLAKLDQLRGLCQQEPKSSTLDTHH